MRRPSQLIDTVLDHTIALGYGNAGLEVRRRLSGWPQDPPLIAEAVPDADVQPVDCDVSSLQELRAFANRFQPQEARLDVLVNNAGMMPGERERSADGTS